MSIKNLTTTTGTTAATLEEVADLVEHSINEAKPNIKTRRGAGSLIEMKIGRRKFLVSVARPVRRRKASLSGNR